MTRPTTRRYDLFFVTAVFAVFTWISGCAAGDTADPTDGVGGESSVVVQGDGGQSGTGGQGGSGGATCTASAEICDGEDNDCDDDVDEGTEGLPCPTGEQGECAMGLTTCESNCTEESTACPQPAPGCFQTVFPVGETCDGKDNDCDGTIDNGIPSSPCFPPNNPSGASYGPKSQCKMGATACLQGAMVCQGGTGPSTEVCDGIDNDCDGQIDEGNPGGGVTCNTGLPGLCNPGTTMCQNGQINCIQTIFPSAETCDGKDNDCDGTVDDGLGSLTCGVGECANTVPACVGGIPQICTPGLPTAELCDGKDNDCNGQTDEVTHQCWIKCWGCLPNNNMGWYGGYVHLTCNQWTGQCPAQQSGQYCELLPEPQGGYCPVRSDPPVE